MSLADAGVQSLATVYIATTTTDTAGNQHLQQGTFAKTDGTTWLTRICGSPPTSCSCVRLIRSMFLKTCAPCPNCWVTAMSPACGRSSAQQELVGNTHLKDLVTQFGTLTDRTAREALTTQIIYAWAGVENVVLGSRGWYARLLSAMEAFVGAEGGGTPRPAPTPVRFLTTGFMEFAQTEYSQLMAQTWFATPYQAIRLQPR